MAVMRILKHGQITIPKEFREVLGLEGGDLAEVELQGEQVVITPKKLVEKPAHSRLAALLEEVHSQNEGVTEEEVVKYATEAIAELRREKREKHAKQQAEHRL